MIGKSWGILRRRPIVTASNLHLPGKFECIGRWRRSAWCTKAELSGLADSKIALLPLLPYTADRRSALLAMYEKMESEIEKLTQQVAEQAEHRSRARLLMTHPGVGPVTANAIRTKLGGLATWLLPLFGVGVAGQEYSPRYS